MPTLKTVIPLVSNPFITTGSGSTITTSNTPGDVLLNCANAAFHMSTGDCIFLFNDVTVSKLQLAYSRDRLSQVNIASLTSGTGGFNLPNTPLGVTICLDNKDNIYVIGASGSSTTTLAVQAFQNGRGLNWTAQTLVTGGSQGGVWKGFAAVWCNTGGGTNGAGHILVIANDASGNTGYWIVDAGKALTGTATGLITANGTNPTFLGSGTASLAGGSLDLTGDGYGASTGGVTFAYGATRGLTFAGNTTNSATAGRWAVSTTGTLSTNAAITTVTTTLSAKSRLRCVNTGVNSFALCYAGSTGAIYVLCATGTTAQPVANANSTIPDGNFDNPGTTRTSGALTADADRWDVVCTGSTIWICGPTFIGDPSVTSLGNSQSATYGWGYIGPSLTSQIGTSGSALEWLPFNLLDPTNPIVGHLDPDVPPTLFEPQSNAANQTSSVSNVELHAMRAVVNPIDLARVDWIGSYRRVDQQIFTILPQTYNFDLTYNFVAYVWVFTPATPFPSSPTVGTTLLTPASGTGLQLSQGGTFTWSFFSSVNGDTQIAYWFRRWNGSAYQWWDGSTWQSIETSVSSSAQSLTFPSGQWSETVNYTWSVKVASSQATGQYPPDFAVASTPSGPVAPSLTAAADGLNNRNTLTVQALDNLLSANSASVETDATGWTSPTNCALSQTTAQALNGTHSLRLGSSASGTMSASTPTGTSGAPVIVGQTYEALASFRSAVSARSCTVGIAWYNGAGTFLSTSTGSSITDSTSAWTQAVVSAAAPASAAYAAVVVSVLSTGGASEIHYIDCASVAAGSSTSWERGGIVPELTIQTSDDGGTTWQNLAVAQLLLMAANGAATVYDYTAPPNASRVYRAQVTDQVWGVAGAWSATAGGSGVTTLPAITSFYLRDPASGQPGIQLNVLPNTFHTNFNESMTAHVCLGRTNPLVVADVVHGEDGQATFWTYSDSDEAALVALVLSQNTLLLQSPEQKQWYIRMRVPMLSQGNFNTGANPFPVTRPHPGSTNRYREHQITWVNVDRP